jgi:hypothetical protein
MPDEDHRCRDIDGQPHSAAKMQRNDRIEDDRERDESERPRSSIRFVVAVSRDDDCRKANHDSQQCVVSIWKRNSAITSATAGTTHTITGIEFDCSRDMFPPHV